MKNTNSILLVVLIIVAVVADLNIVDPILGLGIDVISDHIPFVGNLDEAVLTILGTLAANELKNRQLAKTQA